MRMLALKGERLITKHFLTWYQRENTDSIGVEQFKIDDGTIDLCVFRWFSEIELQCLGVECKTTASPGNIYSHLVQLDRYRETFPTIYLLVRTVRKQEAVKDVCKAKGIGLFRAASATNVEPLMEAGARESNEAKYAAIRSIGAALFCFKDEFPTASLESWGARIPTSPGRVQYNAFLNTPTNECRFGVNAENLHTAGILERWDGLTRAMGKLPDTALVRLWKNLQQGHLRNVIPVTTISASDFDGAVIKEGLKRGKNESWHINVSVPLWSSYDFLTRTQHASRFKKAVRTLTPVFNTMGGSLS